MAPALDALREPGTPDDKPQRRALASVDNLAHMEEDDMGLQSAPNLAKDSQEMEQILVDLGSSDLAQADLLQAIKTLESGGDTLSTGDTDAIFPLSGFDLPDAIDSEGDTTEDKIKQVQARLERRCAFIIRRLRIFQARAIGKRVSDEAAVTFEKCLRGSRKDGSGRTSGLKAFIKKIETTSALQASAASRSVVGPKYFSASTSKGDASRSASIGIPSGTLAGLEDTAGALRYHLSVVKHELDSDATVSSSGAESNDEAVVYNNTHQLPMPIEKRALWSWQRARASIASRWGWLQAQVQELEYKIRQHSDLHRQVRTAKGRVEFEGEPVAYEGPLPGSDWPDDDPVLETCARVRPLRRETFKKRKLLQMHNLHTATTKAAKPADVNCDCQWPLEGCAVCTGRPVAIEPTPPWSTLSAAQKLALVDSCYHPVLSDIRDVTPSTHLAALSSRAWFRSRSRAPHAAPAQRPAPAPVPSSAPSAVSVSAVRPHRTEHLIHSHTPAKIIKTRRLKRGRPPLSRKVRERERDEEPPIYESRPRGRPSAESRQNRVSSFDIDNIVIPQSVAASTRPQILHYKEIITPKWRVMEVPEGPMNNGIAKRASHGMRRHHLSDSEDEDVSEAAVRARHSRSEASEKSRYMMKQRPRRATDTEPAPAPSPPPPPPPDVHEIVRPYSPRRFPLPEDTYQNMLASMPDGHRTASPEPTTNENSPQPSIDDMESSLSPMSPLVYDGDDPDDIEWDPSREKVERRKSAYR